MLYTSSTNKSEIERTLQSDLTSVQKWLLFHKLILNKNKSCSMLFGTRQGLGNSVDLTISFNEGSPLEQVLNFKYLGVWLDPTLSFTQHSETITKKLSCNLAILYRHINCFTFQMRKRIVSQLLLPTLDYADIVYQTTFDTHLQPLNVVYNSLCRFILRCPYITHHCSMYKTKLVIPPRAKMLPLVPVHL